MESTSYVRSVNTNQVIVFEDHITVAQAHVRDRARGQAYIQSLIDGEPAHRTHKYAHDKIIVSVLSLLNGHKTMCSQELLHELAKSYVLSERWLHMHVRRMLDDGLIASIGNTSRQKYYMTTDGYKHFLMS
jgi:hypothetical protein